MKNKISGKIVALLLTLIIVATSGMPLYAKETGDKANSFRYENGQSIAKAVPFSTLSPNAWKKIDGKYYSGDGSVIEGAHPRKNQPHQPPNLRQLQQKIIPDQNL